MDRKEMIDEILTAWTDGRVQWTYSSQDICDEVRDIAHLTAEEVTEWMMKWRYVLVLTDGKMTWVPQEVRNAQCIMHNAKCIMHDTSDSSHLDAEEEP